MTTFVIAMKIYINDTEVNIGGACSITSLLEYVEINTSGCAIAVNNTIVPLKKWNETIVKEEDKVTLIRATQGG